jgi:hypothetical protein
MMAVTFRDALMISTTRFTRYQIASGAYFSTDHSVLAEYPNAALANKKTAAAIGMPRSRSSRVTRPFNTIHRIKKKVNI